MPSESPSPAMIFVGATMHGASPCLVSKAGTSIRIPQPRNNTTFAMFFPSAERCALIGWDTSIRVISLESSLTTAAVFLASSESSKGSAFRCKRLSFNGSVPEMFPLSLGPFTTTPHLCSVAYLTLTSYSGNDGSFNPSNAAQSIGPSSSKCRSALLLTMIPVLSSNVAKFDLKAMSPGAMARPAPMDSNAPRPR